MIATDRRGFQGKNLSLEEIVPVGFAVELATHIYPVLGPQGDPVFSAHVAIPVVVVNARRSR
jgi:hypothetical protein